MARSLLGPSIACVLCGLLISCKQLPEADFSYQPEDDLEAGELVSFINESKDADSFVWDFGDGNTSTEENPLHTYASSQLHIVKLTAMNESGNESVEKSITIYDPTRLAFFIYDSTAENALEGATVWVYEDAEEWEALGDPVLEGSADNAGMVLFMNMEPIIYHIWAFRNEIDGVWIFGGSTDALTKHEDNVYAIPCIWVPDVENNSFQGRPNSNRYFPKVPPGNLFRIAH